MIVTEVAGIAQAVDCAPTVSRPGILAEMLDRAGVRRVSAAEALALCGLEQSGVWLPYLTFAGEPVMDGGKAYGRLRLDKPQQGKKYHQTAGTTVHAYVTPGGGSPAVGLPPPGKPGSRGVAGVAWLWLATGAGRTGGAAPPVLLGSVACQTDVGGGDNSGALVEAQTRRNEHRSRSNGARVVAAGENGHRRVAGARSLPWQSAGRAAPRGPLLLWRRTGRAG
jgi:hypothetical protein